MRSFLAISSVTFAQVTRQPAYGIVVLAGLFAQALSPALAMFGFEQEAGLMKDFSVSTILLLGLVIVALGASTIMEKELESKAFQMLLSKPLPRGVLLAGKYAGLLAALAPAMYVCLLALLLAARQGPPASIHHPWDWPVLAGGLGAVVLTVLFTPLRSLRANRPLVSVSLRLGCAFLTAGWLLAAFFDRQWRLQPFGAGFDPLIVQAVVLVFLAAGLLAAVALVLSLFFVRGAFPVVIAAFFGGLALGGADSIWLSWIPAIPLFWVGDVFYRPEAGIPTAYLALAGLYSFSYAGVCLLVGAWIVNHREVG